MKKTVRTRMTAMASAVVCTASGAIWGAPLSFENVDISQFDFDGSGFIERGREADALVRYANDRIFRTYDKDHNGQLDEEEAINYVEKEVNNALSELSDYMSRTTELRVDSRFPVAANDAEAIERATPDVLRMSRFQTSFGYGQVDEIGKDSESFKVGITSDIATFSTFTTPIVWSFGVGWGKQNTFLETETNKVERITLKPFQFTIGRKDWIARPIYSIGYADTETTNIDTLTGIEEVEDSGQFLYEYGFVTPLLDDRLSLKFTQVVRFDEPFSGRLTDDASIELVFDIQKLLGIPK